MKFAKEPGKTPVFMVLLIDNFDSFTFNIVHAIQRLGLEVRVVRNQAISPIECRKLRCSSLVIGPGPGSPKDTGICPLLIRHFKGKLPILGICLGMQLIAEIFGGVVKRSPRGPMHGKTSSIFHSGKQIFRGLPQGFLATRYHSLIVDRQTLPPCLEITAETKAGEVMGICHKRYPIEGVQFHPESILTESGGQLFDNFFQNRAVLT